MTITFSYLEVFKTSPKKDMDVQAYTEEFYKLSIRVDHAEDDLEKVGRYINGFRYNLQDELSLTNP